MTTQIRRGVFETNSSSSHSITICSEAEYEAFKNGELLLDNDYKTLVKAEGIERHEDDDYKTYQEFLDQEEDETYSKNYTTVSGDKIVAFGSYGDHH